MKYLPIIILVLNIITGSLSAQNLPQSQYFSPNEHIIYTGGKPSTGFYEESVIRNIYLYFDQPDYWNQMVGNYQSKTDIPATMVVDGDTFNQVGVRFKGNTSYSFIQNSQKKSFNITLDFVNPDQEIEGYNTLNLNNAFEDASFMREVSYLHSIRRHIPAAKGSFAKLYINGVSWGIYANVQQIDRRYVDDWFFSNDGTLWRADKPTGTTGGGPGGGGGPGWGDGTGGLNNLGADSTEYKKYYTLKGTDKTEPWEDLINVCNVLNTTPLDSLEQKFSQVMDLDRTLWFLASEIAFSDDDSYVYKGKMDYYIYWDEKTGLMQPLEFDGNTVMKSNNSSWGVFYNANKVNYPLLNRLLVVPSIRQRYLAHMRTILEEELNPTVFNALIDQYKALINDEVEDDTKKLYTFAQFGTEVMAIKNFVQNHRNTLLTNTELNVTSPTLTNVQMRSAHGIWTNPVADKPVQITSNAAFTAGITTVNLYWSVGFLDNFAATSMYDDGLHNDGAANDGQWGAEIPGQAAGTTVRFYVEAIANNAAKTRAYLPVGAEHDVYYYQVTSDWAVVRPVVINEVMASNTNTVTDEAGQYSDWIEVYNLTNQPVDLSGYYLTDNPENIDKWQFPSGTTIQPNGYLIVWADEDGTQGPLHANFKLSAAGESLQLLDANGYLVDTVTFQNQVSNQGYARVPNGTGPFVQQNPTFGADNGTGVPVIDLDLNSINLTVIPNPADDQIMIAKDQNQAALIRITNMQGALIYTNTMTQSLQVPTQHWPAGLYHLQCGNASKKLIINH